MLPAHMLQCHIQYDAPHPSAECPLETVLVQVAKHPGKPFLKKIFRFRPVFGVAQAKAKHGHFKSLIKRPLLCPLAPKARFHQLMFVCCLQCFSGFARLTVGGHRRLMLVQIKVEWLPCGYRGIGMRQDFFLKHN
jgi:hypothetical protein